MSQGMNRVYLCGQLGADAEVRYTQGGTPVCNFRIACTESYLDKDKVKREKTEWASCVLWNKRGEAVAPHLTKGSTVVVEGSLRTSSYDNKDGVKVYRTEIEVREICLVGGKRFESNDESSGGGYGPAQSRQTSLPNRGPTRPAPARPVPQQSEAAKDEAGLFGGCGYGDRSEDELPF